MKNYQLPLSEEFIAYKKQESTVLRGAILVGRTINTDFDQSWVLEKIKHFAEQVITESDGDRSDDLVLFLNKTGFRGATDYYDYANSDIEHVLRSRVGIPISLAVVLMSVADELVITNEGINFPGHFLTSINQRIVDPFSMTFVEDTIWKGWLNRSGLTKKEGFIRASNSQVVLRMLSNLKVLATSRSDFSKALDFSGYQLLLADNLFPLYLERADFWKKLNVPTMALQELESASAIAPDQVTSAELTKQIETLATTPTKLH